MERSIEHTIETDQYTYVLIDGTWQYVVNIRHAGNICSYPVSDSEIIDLLFMIKGVCDE